MSFDLKRPLQLGFRIHFQTANPIRLFITFNSGKGGSYIIKRGSHNQVQLQAFVHKVLRCLISRVTDLIFSLSLSYTHLQL